MEKQFAWLKNWKLSISCLPLKTPNIYWYVKAWKVQQLIELFITWAPELRSFIKPISWWNFWGIRVILISSWSWNASITQIYHYTRKLNKPSVACLVLISSICLLKSYYSSSHMCHSIRYFVDIFVPDLFKHFHFPSTKRNRKNGRFLFTNQFCAVPKCLLSTYSFTKYILIQIIWREYVFFVCNLETTIVSDLSFFNVCHEFSFH